MSTVKSTCYECDANCAIDVTLDDQGEPVSIAGPDCPRCYVQLDRRNHPDRLCIRSSERVHVAAVSSSASPGMRHSPPSLSN